MVDPTFASISLTRYELELIQDCLWYWTSSPGGPKNQRANDASNLRRRFLRLELDAAGWAPTQDFLPMTRPEST